MLRTVEHAIPPRKGEPRGIFFSEVNLAASHCGATVFVDAFDPEHKLIWAKLGMSPTEAATLGHNLIRLANDALASMDAKVGAGETA